MHFLTPLPLILRWVLWQACVMFRLPSAEGCRRQSILPVHKQAGLRLHVPLQALHVVLSAGLPSALCAACHPGAVQLPCVARMHALQVLVGFLMPTGLIYLAEQRFRANFLRSRVSTAG